MKLREKFWVLIQGLRFWWVSRDEVKGKKMDCSCPQCGCSDFDGFCSWCKHKAEKGENWYTGEEVELKK